MNMVQVWRALGPIDLHNVRRDPLLRWLVVLPLAAALAARWFLPSLLAQVETFMQIPLLPYYPPFMAYALLLLGPMLAGVVVGFLLLDQRDDRTLFALQVTPLSLNNYLAYRLALPVLIGLLLSLVVLPLSGLVQLNLLHLLAVALAAAPLAPLFALFLAAFATNKVQGFAIQKGLGVVMLPPVIAYFVPAPWHWLFGLAPTYWPAQVLWQAQSGSGQLWLYLGLGLLAQGFLLWLLLRRFNRLLRQG
jgi:fluoroquinolone transport system permease protein